MWSSPVLVLLLFPCWGTWSVYWIKHTLAFGFRFILQKPRHWAKMSLVLMLVKSKTKNSPKPKSKFKASCSSLQIDVHGLTSWAMGSCSHVQKREGNCYKYLQKTSQDSCLLWHTGRLHWPIGFLFTYSSFFFKKKIKFDFSLLLLRYRLRYRVSCGLPVTQHSLGVSWD